MYKKVGKPHSTADARHVIFPNFRGMGAPVVIDIGGVRHGVSELLQAAYTKPLDICCGFASTLNLYFGFSVLGKIIPVRW